MSLFDKLDDYRVKYISHDSLAKILMIAALIFGAVAGVNLSKAHHSQECNEFIVKEYIVPELENQGYTLKDGFLIKRPVLDNTNMSALDILFRKNFTVNKPNITNIKKFNTK